MDERQAQLLHWSRLNAQIEAGHWEVVAGDASSRRYFRLRQGEASWICVDSPPETEKNPEFLNVRSLMQARGAGVPDLLAVDTDTGFMLLGDLGSTQLLDRLDEQSVDVHYHEALGALLRLYRKQLEEGDLPVYDQQVLLEELGRFPTWFCEALLGIELDATEQAMLDETFHGLVQSALEQPVVFVHRDYHSRNLMLQEDGSLGIIDFQDALLGPVSYDVVSLLKDCYIAWPRERQLAWLEAHRRELLAAGLAGVEDSGQFVRWFDLMGLQRHLKVLGTFARLFLRDGKEAYLQDLPRVLAYVTEVVHGYKEFSGLEALMRERLNPRIELQGWSKKA